ncbi:MAG: hypothetical protein IPF71_13525 [Rhodoferax sp.]|nr:hypothetical protein [Rhodoferax sp.]
MANKTDGLEWDFSTSPAAAEHLKRCIDDAREVFDIYMTGPQTGVFEMGQMRRWLAEHPDLSPFFIVALIEHAASRAQKEGFSIEKSLIAKSKNAAPRAWVIDRWKTRSDRDQSRAAFARETVHLVKKEFRKNLIPET